MKTVAVSANLNKKVVFFIYSIYYNRKTQNNGVIRFEQFTG